jgi:two-component system, NarL family, sensor kinase
MLDRAANDLCLEIGDDGHGIAGARFGVGLVSMRERAQELGGSFTIAGPGTRLRVTLPLTEGE